jgi:tRNA(Ile)-lysidine synthase TilS/MesJ
MKYVENKILKAIPRKVRGHPIAIAISGGKDSLALLNVLYTYRNELKLSSIIIFILEEEIPEIQQERQIILEYIKRKYPSLSVHYVKYSDFYGYTLPDLVNLNDKKDLGYTPCTICGIFRKQALFNLGLQNGVDFIALGTTLEDEVTTSILNTVRGLTQHWRMR